MNHRPLAGSLIALLFVAVLPLQAAPPPKPTVATKAGSITALLPVAHIVRGTGKAQTSTDAKKGSELVWQDTVRTEKGGRARIQLLDESILSVGSQAELRIVQHDAKSQQTSLALTYGRMRAEVTKITRDGGSFSLRTPTAVAGVIGTQFASNASQTNTDFVCFEGDTKIGNADPNVGGEEHCAPGDFVSVAGGKAPTKRKATPQEMQEALQETVACVISALAPGALLVGTGVDAVATGSNLGGVNKVAVSGSGVQAKLNPGGTDTAVNVHINADANAAPGPRTVTFTRSKGPDVVAVINVQAAPGGDAASMRKGYEDLIEQERGSALTAIGGVADQIANQAAQAKSEIDNANKNNRDVSKADSDLQTQADAVRSAAERARSAVDGAAGTAQNDLKSRFDAAVQALNGRVPSGAPDDVFTKALADAFNEVNGTLQGALRAAGESLGGAANSASGNIAQIAQNWLDQLRGLSGGGALGEQSVEVGNSFRYTAPGGGNITSYEWSLCAATGSCTPLPGFSSSAPDFTAVTCSLQPGDYRVHLVTTDAAGNRNSSDSMLHVLPTAYDDPPTTLRNLADSYVTLQPSRFLGYFDATQFSGFTQLSENVRRTFKILASMNINLRVSQAQINCNDATVRADWEQNYSFQDNPNIVYHQVEQLSVRMNRDGGNGWRIVDFQGDNGTVQGLPPGPQVSDAALPDIEVQITNVTTTTGAARLSGARRAAVRGAVSASNDPTPIPTGNVLVTATVTNVGKAPLTQTVKVHLSLTDAAGAEIAGVDVDVSPPLLPGHSVQVSGRIVVPQLTPGTPGQLVGVGNPGCVVQTASCGTVSTDVVPVIVGNVDLAIQSIAPGANLIGTTAGVVNVTIKNLGSTGSSPSSNNLVVTSPDFAGFQATAGIPPIASGATAVVPIAVTWPNGSGAHNFVVRITPAAQFDNNATNDTLTQSITLTAPLIDLSMQNLAYTAAGSPPFLGGQSRGVTFQVHNTGNVPSNAADTFACSLTGPLGTRALGSGTIPVVAANATSATITFNFTIPTNFAGSNNLVCIVNKDPLESNGALANNSLSIGAQTNGNIDLTVPAPTAQIIAQMGGAGTITVRINNTGLDDAPAGYDVVARINGSPVGSGIGPNVPAGGSALATVNVTVPQLAAAPADISGSLQIDVNTNNAVQEVNTANNSLLTTVRLVDFTLTTLPSGTVQVVAGRAVSFAAVSINPPTYPLAVTINYSGAPAGLAGSGSQGTTLAGTVTAPAGPFTVNVSGTVGGVTHPSNQPIAIQVLSEITLTPTPVTIAQGGSGNLQVAVTGGVFPVQVTIGLPAGVSTTNPLTQTANTPGNLTWNLQVVAGTPLGNLTAPLHATDAGIPTRNIPAGNVNVNATIVVSNAPPQANYVPLTMQIAGHGPAPFTGSNSLTVGENLIVTVPVKNIGGASPTGFIVVSIACIGSCNPPFQTSIPAPAAGQTVNAVFNIPTQLTSQVPPGPYTAQIGISTSITQSTADDQITIAVNVNAATGTPDFAMQNAALGGTSAGRNTSSNPILYGETFQVTFTVKNNGTGPNVNPIEVGASINGRLVGFQQITQQLAAGQSTPVTLSVWMPDDTTIGIVAQVHLVVVPATGETNVLDNFATLNVNAANWTVVVVPGSPGESNGNPIAMHPPVGITGNTSIRAQLVGSGGSLLVPIPISVTLTSTHISVPSAPSQLTSANNFTGAVNVAEDATTPDALYYAQVVATLPAPAFVSDFVTTKDTKRGATIFINTIVLPAFTDSIFVSSSRNNTSTETPLQVNGFLREPLSVSPNRSSCLAFTGPPPPCPGATDLTFIDADQIVTTPQQVKAVPWQSIAQVQVESTLDLDGFVIEGTNVQSVVSAEAFSVLSNRDNPQTAAVNPVRTLFYRIGDLLLNGGSCVRVPPGGQGTLNVQFTADNGFNIPNVNWTWETSEFPFAGGGLSVSPATGNSTFTGSAYSPLPPFVFSNANTVANAPIELQSVFFDITISNGNDTVTATFLDLAVDMSAAGGLCGATASGVGSAHRGSWSRGALGSAARRIRGKRAGAAALPDLTISASDVSFSPSSPRAGDAVSVRFRVSNSGGDATRVPIALQVNGVTVATDTFDVAAGAATLGALEWSNARVGGSRGRGNRPFAPAAAGGVIDAAAPGGPVALNIALVIDPDRTLIQRTSGIKSVAVPHFVLRPDVTGVSTDDVVASGPEQRLLVEVAESACAGLRLSSGASGGCDSADVEFTVPDLGAGTYRLQAQNGIADLGISQVAAAASTSLVPFSSSVSALAGHSYAVRLNNGRVAVMTVRAIRNPQQLEARSRTVFTRNGAGQLIRQLGGGSGPVQPGDTSGHTEPARVYFDVSFRGQ